MNNIQVYMTNLKESLSSLPNEIQNYVFDYYNPYKEIFTKTIIKTDDIWKYAWLRCHRLQTDPIIHFVMEYFLKEIGLYEHGYDFESTKLLYWLPDNITISYHDDNNDYSLAIIHSEDRMDEFRVYDNEQWRKLCYDGHHSPRFTTIDWNDEYWLVQLVH